MFQVIGKKMFSKDELLNKLVEWGFTNAHEIIRYTEKNRRCAFNGLKIMYVPQRS